MTKTKIKGPTKAALKRSVIELTAQLAFNYSVADRDLDGAGGGLMGSGVLLQLTALGGREIMKPIVIRDGLSAETIAAIRNDIIRSYELAVMYGPRKR